MQGWTTVWWAVCGCHVSIFSFASCLKSTLKIPTGVTEHIPDATLCSARQRITHLVFFSARAELVRQQRSDNNSRSHRINKIGANPDKQNSPFLKSARQSEAAARTESERAAVSGRITGVFSLLASVWVELASVLFEAPLAVRR